MIIPTLNYDNDNNNEQIINFSEKKDIKGFSFYVTNNANENGPKKIINFQNG